MAWVAQTAMRKAIGRATVAEVAMRRDQLDAELKDASRRSSALGYRHHRRGGARHRRSEGAAGGHGHGGRGRAQEDARMVLAEAEKDISEMLKDASEVYAGDQDA